jgi:hypothetical protein
MSDFWESKAVYYNISSYFINIKVTLINKKLNYIIYNIKTLNI